jgi:REP element-mobilizing transposase RayT
LEGWDYRRPGFYYLTICTLGRDPCLGEVESGQVKPSAYGQLVAREWQGIPAGCSRATLDSWIVMPDHLHGIVILGAVLQSRSRSRWQRSLANSRSDRPKPSGPWVIRPSPGRNGSMTESSTASKPWKRPAPTSVRTRTAGKPSERSPRNPIAPPWRHRSVETAQSSTDALSGCTAGGPSLRRADRDDLTLALMKTPREGEPGSLSPRLWK